jgi:hypothetical protein
MTSDEPLTLYGAQASGAVAVEAALVLLQRPYRLIEGSTRCTGSSPTCAAPAMSPVVRRVDEAPRLAELWRTRFPFDDE